jgi:hypothetical protein
VESGSIIDVSGTPDVYVPLDQNIIDVQLRGSELADAPLQRDKSLRGKTLTVDLRKSGIYGQRYWIGTPLGDATGFANIIQRNVAQLTTPGGTVEIAAGGSIDLANSSELNVSGGYFRNQGGLVNTTKLLQNGRVVDISKATPDQVYDGVFSDFIESNPSAKWSAPIQHKAPLAPSQATREPDYIQGAAGGSVNLSAPKMALGGKILGQTANGPRQLDSPPAMSGISLNIQKDKIVEFSDTQTKVPAFNLPVPVVFTKAGTSTASGLELPGVAMDSPLFVPLELFQDEKGGFGRLTVDNQDGSILLPSGTPMVLPAGGRVSLSAGNVDILSPNQCPWRFSFDHCFQHAVLAIQRPRIQVPADHKPVPDQSRSRHSHTRNWKQYQCSGNSRRRPVFCRIVQHLSAFPEWRIDRTGRIQFKHQSINNA